MLKEMKKLDECDVEKFGRLESSAKTIAILGDRWWLRTVKQEGDKISKHVFCNVWEKRIERPHVGVVSIGSRNGAPSRKGCVVDGRIGEQKMRTPPLNMPPACKEGDRISNVYFMLYMAETC